MKQTDNKRGGHAWKACDRQKRPGGSNPPHSARFMPRGHVSAPVAPSPGNVAKAGKTGQNVAKKTTMALHSIKIVPQLIASRVRNDGRAAVRFAVNYRSKTAYIPANVWITPEQWHERKVIKHPAAATINSYLRALLVQLEGAVLEIIRDGRQHGLDVYGVRDLIVEIITPAVADEPTLCDVLGEIISDAAGDGTRGVYTSTLHRVEQFSQRPPRFRDITPEWLQSFDAWLADNGTPSVNARNIHMRNIRAAFNRALNEKRTSADYPFRAFTIKPQPTPAASYTPAELRALFSAAELSPLEAYWLDMFRLSFFFIGINVADLWSLGRIERGRINYTRRKTGRRYSVAVTPEAAEIIARHRGASSLVDMCERYKNTKAATIAANKYLQRIAERLRLPRPTWYTARYSWATIAANDCDAPVETIALALGHTYGRAVTLGYINPDASKVDRLNREIIALILK